MDYRIILSNAIFSFFKYFSVHECQIYLDVDCSNITYDTPVSQVVLEAANKTLEKLENVDLQENSLNGSSPNATLENSLLSSIDPDTATQTEITEAYCRDVDSFSWEFAEPKRELSFLEQLDENKWYILIGVVVFIYIAIMLRSRIKHLYQTRCFTRPKPGSSVGDEAAMTYRGVVAVPTQQSDQTDNSPYDPGQSADQKLPYPNQPVQPGDQHLPYPVQPGDQQLPYPNQPPPPPPSYEVASLPYPADNKQPPYNPHT